MQRYFFDSRSVILLVVSIIATMAVALRLWARRILKIRLELNDYLIVLGLAFALVEAVMYIYATISMAAVAEEVESDRFGSVESIQTVLLASKLYFLSQVMWAVAVTLIRSSVILLYIRIFPTRSFRLTCYSVLAINAIFGTGAILTDCLICLPVACRRDIIVADCRCGNELVFGKLNAMINLLLDVTVVVLPMPLLWCLQMAVSQKLTLSGMFGLGIAICAVTAYRFQQVTTVGVGNIADILDDRTQPVMFLTSVEATLGVLNACLPVLKPVFRKVRDSVPKPNWWKGTKTSIKSGSIPIFMRVSQMWQSSSGGRSRRDGLDSIISMENLTRSESAIQSSSKVDNVLGTKGSEIHVQRDIVVESTSIEV